MNRATAASIAVTALTALVIAPAARAADPLELEPVGRTDPQGEGGAEIAAFDPDSRRAFVTNAAENALDIYSLDDPSDPERIDSIDLSPYGGGPNSVDVSRREGGIVAVAVEAEEKTDRGTVEFFDTDGEHLRGLRVGALPDMVTFTGDGRTLLVANEGEPSDDYSDDPEGSVSVVELQRGLERARAREATFRGVPLKGDVRVFGPGASTREDLEPEYIAVDGRDDEALVTLQENNAVAVLDIDKRRFRYVRGLGYKNHGSRRNALDPSDKDGIDIDPFRNVFGMYQPDAIAAYPRKRESRFVIVNEGDARDYDGFSEETRVSGLSLDRGAFRANAATDTELGRLTVTNTMGDDDEDGDFDRLFAFGGRSVSVLDEDARMRSDTGSELERLTATLDPGNFNVDNVAGSPPDNRSDNKGPEPEGVDVGKVDGRAYAFVGAERQGGIFAYDLDANPGDVEFAGYVNTRDEDLGPEGVRFISDEDSPDGDPLVLVTNEISGTVTVLRPERGE